MLNINNFSLAVNDKIILSLVNDHNWSGNQRLSITDGGIMADTCEQNVENIHQRGLREMVKNKKKTPLIILITIIIRLRQNRSTVSLSLPLYSWAVHTLV